MVYASRTVPSSRFVRSIRRTRALPVGARSRIVCLPRSSSKPFRKTLSTEVLPVPARPHGEPEESAWLGLANASAFSFLARSSTSGDTLNRRRLTICLCALTAVALLAASWSPSYHLFGIALMMVGLSSCAVQVLVPFAASLAPDATRGRVVGTVMSGLLLGILLARTVSGLIAGFAGWRAVYIFAFSAMTILIALLGKMLPPDPHRPHTPYLQLLRSTGRLALEDATLRERSLYGALAFTAFSLLWTGLTFVLSAPPYSFSESRIGLFGLAGAAGAFSASGAGRLADRGRSRFATGLFGTAITASYGLIWLGGRSWLR